MFETKQGSLKSGFQGKLNYTRYFEGWYTRIVNPINGNSTVVILGICLNPNHSFGFIQWFDSNNNVHFKEYPISACTFKHTPSWSVNIGGNRLSEKQLFVNDAGLAISVKFDEVAVLPRGIWGDGVLGPASYLNVLPCNHAVIGLYAMGSLQSHQDRGTAVLAYLEKDWGKTFPNKHIWLQAFFPSQEGSLMLAIAELNVLGIRFNVYTAALKIDKHTHLFNQYQFAKMNVSHVDSQSVDLMFTYKHKRLHVKARMHDAVKLKSPSESGMGGVVSESLNATVEVTMKDKSNNQYLSTHTGALEIEW